MYCIYSFTKIFLFDKRYVPIYSYMYILYLWCNPPPPHTHTHKHTLTILLYMVYMTTSVKFSVNLWHIIDILWQNYTNKFSILVTKIHVISYWKGKFLILRVDLYFQCSNLITGTWSSVIHRVWFWRTKSW